MTSDLPSTNPGRIYTDNVLEFNRACEDFAWANDASTPRRPQTNGIVEREQYSELNGTAAVLVQSESGLTDGDLIVAEWDDIESCEPISGVHFKRFKWDEVIIIKESGLHRLPCVDGSLEHSVNVVPRHPHRLSSVRERTTHAEANLLADEENTVISSAVNSKTFCSTSFFLSNSPEVP